MAKQPGRERDEQADAAPARRKPEPGTAFGAGRASSWCGTAWRGTARSLWRGTAPLSTAQPLAVTVSLGRDTAGGSTRGCGWHQRDREHHGGRDGLSPSAGASRGSCPGTQHPAPIHHMLALSVNPAGFGRGGGARGLFQSDAQGLRHSSVPAAGAALSPSQPSPSLTPQERSGFDSWWNQEGGEGEWQARKRLRNVTRSLPRQ